MGRVEEEGGGGLAVINIFEEFRLDFITETNQFCCRFLRVDYLYCILLSTLYNYFY